MWLVLVFDLVRRLVVVVLVRRLFIVIMVRHLFVCMRAIQTSRVYLINEKKIKLIIVNMLHNWNYRYLVIIVISNV